MLYAFQKKNYKCTLNGNDWKYFFAVFYINVRERKRDLFIKVLMFQG